MRPDDLDRVMELWLAGNLQAHGFIPAAYWRENVPMVREAISRSEALAFVESGRLLGFAGLDGDYIAGIFVDRECRSRGVGAALLAACKQRHERLYLDVYEENQGARRFYEKHGFSAKERRAGEHPEWRMEWKGEPR